MRLAKVTPKMLENEGSWDPVVLCGPMAGLLGGNVAGSLDTWEASVVDGTRAPEKPVVGAAHIGFGELMLNSDCPASAFPPKIKPKSSSRIFPHKKREQV